MDETMDEIIITLTDMDAWDDFASANCDALEDSYGSIANALKHCMDGGLTLGGGAAPMFYIHFEM